MIREIKWYPENPPGQRIKYVGELHDKKIGCCCESPGDCCLYPIGGFVAEEYTASDLPDTIEIDGNTFTKSGDTYLGTILGDDYFLVSNGFNFWAIANNPYMGGEIWQGTCLIGGYISVSGGSEGKTVADQFPSSLSMSFNDNLGLSGTCVMNRDSSIAWSGIDISTGTACDVTYLCPGEFVEAPYKWGASFTAGGAGGGNGIKIDPQNTMIGAYDAGDGSISVS